MKHTKYLLLFAVSLFSLLWFASGVGATVTVDAVSEATTADYTLYYDSENGKMYTDEAMTQVYTDQTTKWSAVYDSEQENYALKLNNFSFSTSARVAMVFPENAEIRLAPGSNNTIENTVYRDKNDTYGILAKKDLTILGMGDGSGFLLVQSGTAMGIDGYYSRGLKVDGLLQFFSGFVTTSAGGDNLGIGTEISSMGYYSGRFCSLGQDGAFHFTEGQSEGYFLYNTTGTIFYGGRDASDMDQQQIGSGNDALAPLMTNQYIEISNIYTDVAYNAWYGPCIYESIHFGMITGYPSSDGVSFKVRPESSITRAEFVTMLARVFLSEDELKDYADMYTFTDIPNWASKYVGWAAENSYVGGYNASTFGANDNITRQDIVTILHRIIKDATSNTPKEPITFTDAAAIADYAATAVSAMQQAGVINGYSNGDGSFRFKPQGNATRAEPRPAGWADYGCRSRYHAPEL